jgi:hypothetical protein
VLLESYGSRHGSSVDSEGGMKKKGLNNPWILSRLGRGRFMLMEKNKQMTMHRFGELELVDKSLFFICANRRDN